MYLITVVISVISTEGIAEREPPWMLPSPLSECFILEQWPYQVTTVVRSESIWFSRCLSSCIIISPFKFCSILKWILLGFSSDIMLSQMSNIQPQSVGFKSRNVFWGGFAALQNFVGSCHFCVLKCILNIPKKEWRLI